MEAAKFKKAVLEEVGRIILGKKEQTELIIMAMLAGGHVLLDDLPGVGKTTLVKTFSKASGCSTRRIQFVPDLLPSDITGMNIYDRETGGFKRLEGPVFCNILLADEINRAVPRTQAALLEAMEEKNVTIDGVTYELPQPFIVLATQNPVESESTFRLPAAQMDRFLIRISMGYPDSGEEKQMLLNEGRGVGQEMVNVVSSAEHIRRLREEVAGVQVSEPVAEYMVALAAATRSCRGVRMGAGPRATKALYNASRAWAAMQDRNYVIPDDVKTLAPYVLTHRLILSGDARLSGNTAEKVIRKILEETPVPPEKRHEFDE